jgi:hypothetical protein
LTFVEHFELSKTQESQDIPNRNTSTHVAVIASHCATFLLLAIYMGAEFVTQPYSAAINDNRKCEYECEYECEYQRDVER